MMPQESIRDMMLRTMENLRFIEEHATGKGPYEVTQLVNSFLSALAHPWEEYKQELNSMALEHAISNGWPKLKKERATDIDPSSLGDLLRLVRNSLAHGDIEYLGKSSSEITHLRFWNNNKRGKRTWGVIASITDMRMLLESFAKLAEELTNIDLDHRMERRSA
jgi:hypothetical protein